MNKLESVEKEMTELKRMLGDCFLTLSQVSECHSGADDGDTFSLRLVLSTEGGEKWGLDFDDDEFDDEGAESPAAPETVREAPQRQRLPQEKKKRERRCELNLSITGFGRQFCDVALEPGGNVLQHQTARAVVLYTANLLFANGYKLLRIPEKDSGSVHNSTWIRENVLLPGASL